MLSLCVAVQQTNLPTLTDRQAAALQHRINRSLAFATLGRRFQHPFSEHSMMTLRESIWADMQSKQHQEMHYLLPAADTRFTRCYIYIRLPVKCKSCSYNTRFM